MIKNNLFKILLYLIIIQIYVPNILVASHLEGKSKSEKERYLKIRIEQIPNNHNKVIIKPSNSLKKINKDVKKNKKISQMIDKSSLLSVIYYDGEKVVIDQKSDKIKEDTKIYSFSMSKSIASYMLGDAICNGYIKSLDDQIVNYVPEAKGTLYENSTFKDLINMSAGDLNFANRKAGSKKFIYADKIIRKKFTAKDYLLSSVGVKKSKKLFNYHNFLTDFVARAVDNQVPGGLQKSYQNLANRAGTKSEMFYIEDSNGWPLLFAWFYAEREDYLRIAIQIAKDWKSQSCIGNYLRNIESMQIKADRGGGKGSNYAGYFWFDRSIKSRHVQMRGHGNQRIHINLENGSILLFHAIAGDFDSKKLFKLVK